MSDRPDPDRPDPERLVLEELTDDERRELLTTVDPGAALLVDRIAVALGALDDDGWRAAETPTLRFAPDGLDRPVPFWARFCVRSDAGEHQVAAPAVAVAVAVAVLLAFVGGFVTRGLLEAGQDPEGERQAHSAPAAPPSRESGQPLGDATP